MALILSNEEQVIKFRDGNFLYPVTTWVRDDRRYLKFNFNRKFISEVKAMEGARWSPTEKYWHVSNTQRNRFQIRFLANEPVYGRYDAKLDVESLGIPVERRNLRADAILRLFGHQREGVAHILARHHCGVAGEMGTGKSLMALIASEIACEVAGQYESWFVAPKPALLSVQRDYRIWGAKREPSWFTYEGLTKEMKNWRAGRKAPFFITFDEFSRCKNWTAQRTQAAKSIADGVRDDWGDAGYIVGMTGTPAPKSPADWWAQAEILCPGFLKEGDVNKFKRRLAIITMKEGTDGAGSYPQLLAWRDNPAKCNICGQLQNHENHLEELQGIYPEIHKFEASTNEVALLGERLKGLFVVYFKKDCLDLPDKHYRIIEVEPSPSTLRAANLLVRSARTTIEGLTRLRELSDGFQYVDKRTGEATCTVCKGAKEIAHPIEVPDTCPNCKAGAVDEAVRDSAFQIGCSDHRPQVREGVIECPNCSGKGVVDTFDRHTESVACPKDDAFDELLDEYEDVGRIVAYGGFSGTIDRIVALCQRRGWYVIRMDQGQIRIIDPKGDVCEGIIDFQAMFLDQLTEYDKVAFVAHPKSGGMGLTLTSSPVVIYYSNDFDGEARPQSEDRIHRPGMDLNLGATIIDIFHLPSDRKVLDNLRKKRDLQAMTLNEFYSGLQSESTGERAK